MEDKEKDIRDKLKKTANEFKDNVDQISEEIKDTVDKVEDKIENFEEKYINAIAEMENLRKRFENERGELYKYRASSFIQEILPTIDMFEMALSSKDVSDEIKNWLIGFEMILKNLKATLESEGVKEINVKIGDKFDSDLHHGIEQEESDEVLPGHILKIKQKGYLLHKRLLRPAMVIVAKTKEEENNTEVEKGDKNE